MADTKVNFVQKKVPVGEAPKAEVKVKKPLKLWVIILPVVLIGMYSGTFMYIRSVIKHREELAAKAKAPAKEKPLTNPVFVLEPFSTNLNVENDHPKILDVDMGFEYETDQTLAELRAKLPQVRDEVIMLLSSKELQEVNSPEKVRKLQGQILARMNKLLLTGKITTVYFTDFVIKDKR